MKKATTTKIYYTFKPRKRGFVLKKEFQGKIDEDELDNDDFAEIVETGKVPGYISNNPHDCVECMVDVQIFCHEETVTEIGKNENTFTFVCEECERDVAITNWEKDITINKNDIGDITECICTCPYCDEDISIYIPKYLLPKLSKCKVTQY